MKMVPLGEVAGFASGGTPDRKNHSFYQGEIPWITGADIDDEGRVHTRHHITEQAVQKSATRIARENSLLLVTRTAVGKTLIPPHPISFSQDLTAITPCDNLDLKYLSRFLQNRSKYFEQHSRGATIRGITRQVVEELSVPLPPLEEQRRIAAILDKADAIRQKRRQAIAHLNLLTQSAFKHLTSTTMTRASLSELGLDFISGKNVVGSAQNTHPENRVLKVNAISSGTFKSNEIKSMPADYSPPKRHAVQKNDILFGRASGSLDLLGATAVVDKEVDNLYLPDKVWKLQINDALAIDPGYALGILRSDSFKSYVRHNASGAAGVKNISRSKVLNYQAPVADTVHQQNFSAITTRAQHALAHMSSKMKAADALFASLQSRAFQGEL